ncbi:hypothetical protein ASC95_08555 [Pelomonas sp. Root1217]|uniref:hypothetical protein n=1 Tax=Pelomonas sp. Root1217 TaxID=1736430 RepID=UPI000709C118|nr:hypothetical protein [Pelomonas sp. Root1217]KQV52846.1 hypothetical protein ASC95_08555 [Pelomonas sp. Root1217]
MASLSTFRRLNALALFQLFAEERIAAGDPPKGLESAWALKIEVSGATWSMAKSGARPIGDKLARQIERHCGKEAGWLDDEREPAGLTPGEQQFLSFALNTYRQTNSDGRKRLKQLLKSFG